VADTIWITGVSGFTGRYLARYIKSLPERFRIVGIGRVNVENEYVDAFHKVDLHKNDMVVRAASLDPPSVVFHLAGAIPPVAESEMWHTNVGGTVNLLSGLSKAGCDNTTVICVGSAAEYMMSEDGLLDETCRCGGGSVYGNTKWTQTSIALSLGRQLGIAVKVVRPFNMVGPGLSHNLVTGRLCAQFSDPNSKTVVVGNTKSERDFVDVRDVVAAYWDVSTKGKDGEIYNVCSGIPTSIDTLIDIFASMSKVHKEVVVDSKIFRKVDMDSVFGNGKKISEATAWSPRISLEKSIGDMLDAAFESGKH